MRHRLLPSPYDPIARLYDPWSRSVTEDVAFYVAEARKASGGAGRRARRRHRADRRPDRRGGRPRDRRRLVGRDARGLPRRGPSTRASPSCSTCASATCATRRSTSASRSSPAPSARTSTSTATPSASRALARGPRAARRRAAASSSTSSRRRRDDIDETHGRWLEREPGIWERADWDESERRLTLSVRGDASGEATMTLVLDLGRRVADAARAQPASRSRPATAGSTGARTRAARTPSGSPRRV